MGNPWITTDHHSNISNICRGLIESHGIPGNEVAPGAHLAVGTALLHDMHDNLLTTCSRSQCFSGSHCFFRAELHVLSRGISTESSLEMSNQWRPMVKKDNCFLEQKVKLRA